MDETTPGMKRVFFEVEEDVFIQGGVFVFHGIKDVDDRTAKLVRVVPAYDITQWDKVLLLQTALERERVRLQRLIK